MIYTDAGMFCDLAPFLIAAAAFFGCMVSPPFSLDVDAWQGQLGLIMMCPGGAIPGRPFAFLRRPYHLVDNQTRFELLGCLARPSNLPAVAESGGKLLLTNHVNSSGTEIQRAIW